jgi:hypothetical protein
VWLRVSPRTWGTAKHVGRAERQRLVAGASGGLGSMACTLAAEPAVVEIGDIIVAAGSRWFRNAGGAVGVAVERLRQGGQVDEVLERGDGDRQRVVASSGAGVCGRTRAAQV